MGLGRSLLSSSLIGVLAPRAGALLNTNPETREPFPFPRPASMNAAVETSIRRQRWWCSCNLPSTEDRAPEAVPWTTVSTSFLAVDDHINMIHDGLLRTGTWSANGAHREPLHSRRRPKYDGVRTTLEEFLLVTREDCGRLSNTRLSRSGSGTQGPHRGRHPKQRPSCCATNSCCRWTSMRDGVTLA